MNGARFSPAVSLTFQKSQITARQPPPPPPRLCSDVTVMVGQVWGIQAKQRLPQMATLPPWRFGALGLWLSVLLLSIKSPVCPFSWIRYQQWWQHDYRGSPTFSLDYIYVPPAVRYHQLRNTALELPKPHPATYWQTTTYLLWKAK